MLTKNDLQEQLRRLSSTADKIGEALADGPDPPGLDLAEAAVGVARLQTALEKLSAKLDGTSGKARSNRKKKG